MRSDKCKVNELIFLRYDTSFNNKGDLYSNAKKTHKKGSVCLSTCKALLKKLKQDKLNLPQQTREKEQKKPKTCCRETRTRRAGGHNQGR